MPSYLHDQQAVLGAKWFKRQGFAVVATDLMSVGVSERADVVAFRSGRNRPVCGVIESKISRSDFLADRNKLHRSVAGLGVYRFYICPSGLILPEELPAKWGLLYVQGNRVIDVVRPQGNHWPDYDTPSRGWDDFKHESDAQAEAHALFSIARLLAIGKPTIKTPKAQPPADKNAESVSALECEF
jgi:hypothetical protein